jgi:hypothetical protein
MGVKLSEMGRYQMGQYYKILPMILFLLYSLCVVCPDRFAFVSSKQQQQFAPGDAEQPCDHDRNGASGYQCRQLASEYLPTQTVKVSQHVSIHVIATPSLDPAADNLFVLFLTVTHPPNFDPPTAPLHTKLRI